ncbi:MAG: deoxyribodipyrimidine photo-lyase [Spirochaetota bacterium]
MSPTDPFRERCTDLNDAPVRSGGYILYWMQRAQRASTNHALEYAVRLANDRRIPLIVGFGLTADYPEASVRHYRFMLEGLAETAETLRRRGVGFVVRIGDPAAVALDLGRDASAIVCDRAYLRHPRGWRYEVARTAGCRVVEVESDLIVPVESASSKQEYAARTIRPRIHRRLGEFAMPLESEPVVVRAAEVEPRGESLDDIPGLIARLGPRERPGAVTPFFRGGYSEARARLDRFLGERLRDYEENRSEPGLDLGSELSPYLHFGHISSLEVALAAGVDQFVEGLEAGRGAMKNQPGSVGVRTDASREASSRDAFLEELIVRRGLAHNYVWYAADYDVYGGLPGWARKTLADHRSDEREYRYTREELLAAQTHDPHWNNATREMLLTGHMHNYMRMYWGKKILEWTDDPAEAFATTLSLNNEWFLDGRDPNSYANVAWVFGLHDRPWTEREIFGKVRYMNANGLKRKFDMDLYRAKVDRLADATEG